MKRLTPQPAHLGEGPCWHADEHVLYWVDILGKRLHRYDPDGHRNASWDLPEMVGTVAPRHSGGLVLALQNGIAFFDPESGALEKQPDIDPQPRTRFNDGKCDPQGRLWCGTMDIEETDTLGALYRIDPSGEVTQWAEDVGVSNGLTWSPDQRRMYYIDSPTRRIDVFDMDPHSGDISNRRPLVEFTEEEGFPDGMTSDSEGNLWVAHWAGARITKRDPDTGAVLETHATHAYQTSACCFGGPNLTDLFVTTAGVDLTPEQHTRFPDSGHLLHLKTSPAGVPTYPFRG